MPGRTMLAVIAALAVTSPVAEARTEVSVMTWNVCAGTNAACGLYRAGVERLAGDVAQYAVDQPIRPDVIFLQEFCAGADRALELALETRTGREWSVRSWSLLSSAGEPYACHPDRLGSSRGALSVAMAVADDAVTFTTHPLTTPPWYVKRAVICAAVPARRIHACGAHLSSGERYDDREPGAPYRTRQIKELMGVATKPGYWTVFGGDLNLAPPGTGGSRAGGAHPMGPAYSAFRECDHHETGRPGRWTYSDGVVRKKLDYLFTPRAATLRCHVAPLTPRSDHRPVYVKVRV